MALEFDSQSDSRIKDIRGVSDSASDLDTINALQVTDYTLKDKVRNGNKPFKKVIAQQVEKVYPQVVSQHVDFIPNVYRIAEHGHEDRRRHAASLRQRPRTEPGCQAPQAADVRRPHDAAGWHRVHSDPTATC